MAHDNKIELSRRTILGGLGTIGVAAAGAGLGTSAYFSDDETFENNVLSAGSLDLKVDWEEHYSDWSEDEDDNPDGDRPLDVRMNLDGASEVDYTAFPPGVEASNDDPLLYVNNNDVGQFMDNTSIEAFPDADNDGVQNDFNPENACEVLADVGGDDNGLDHTGARTNNEDTRGESGSAPLINLNDVKPGDFGELTLSFHLCDNPGYVWLNAANKTASENGVTEPEAEDPDEDQTLNESGEVVPKEGVNDTTVELFDAIQTAWWYDENCDNLTQGGQDTQLADVMVVLDRSGSMDDEPDKFLDAKAGAKSLVEVLGPGAEFGLVSFGLGSATLDEPLGADETSYDNEVDGLSALGQTNIDAALDAAANELNSNGRSGADSIIVLLTNGTPTTGDDPRTRANTFKGNGGTIYGIAYGSGANLTLIEDVSSDPDSDFAFEADQANVVDIFDDIGEAITTGEEIFFQGSLRNALGALTSDLGIPLDGDGGNDFDELQDDPNADSRGCFEPTPATNCIGFSWWLPVDHANEIQTDSVGFDLGFYTEQCRHNDGSGQAAENQSA